MNHAIPSESLPVKILTAAEVAEISEELGNEPWKPKQVAALDSLVRSCEAFRAHGIALQLQIKVLLAVDENAETLVEIGKGLRDAELGLAAPLDAIRQNIRLQLELKEKREAVELLRADNGRLKGLIEGMGHEEDCRSRQSCCIPEHGSFHFPCDCVKSKVEVKG